MFNIEAKTKQMQLAIDILTIAKELEDISETIVDKAKMNTTYDTGQLQKSWTRSEVRKGKGGLYVKVFNPLNYADYYERGHRKRNCKATTKKEAIKNNGWVKGRFPLKRAMKTVKLVINKDIFKMSYHRFKERDEV